MVSMNYTTRFVPSLMYRRYHRYLRNALSPSNSTFQPELPISEDSGRKEATRKSNSNVALEHMFRSIQKDLGSPASISVMRFSDEVNQYVDELQSSLDQADDPFIIREHERILRQLRQELRESTNRLDLLLGDIARKDTYLVSEFMGHPVYGMTRLIRNMGLIAWYAFTRPRETMYFDAVTGKLLDRHGGEKRDRGD